MTDFFPIEEENNSAPVNAFAKPAKLKVSRTRENETRDMETRITDEEMAHYAEVFAMRSAGTTYMPPEATPPGYVGMWVRTGCRGRADSSNVHERERLGWLAPSSSKFPRMAMKNIYGDITDDQNVLHRRGLMWMLRPKAIHDLEMSTRQLKKDMAALYVQSARKMGTEGSFMTGRHNGQTVTFSDDPKAQYIASLFGR